MSVFLSRPSLHWVRTFACAVSLAALAGAGRAEKLKDDVGGGRPSFTAADSIEMVRFGETSSAYPYGVKQINWNRRHTMFTYVTWRGNLDSGLNDYSLWLIEVDPSGSFNRPRLLAKFSTDTPWPSEAAIEQVMWNATGDGVTFIGRRHGKPDNVYEVDIKSGEMRPLLIREIPVKEVSFYIIHSGTGSILFGGYGRVSDEMNSRKGYVVGERNVPRGFTNRPGWEISEFDERMDTKVYGQYLYRANGDITPINVPIDAWPWPPQLSPSGNFAVAYGSIMPPDAWLDHPAYKQVKAATAPQGRAELENSRDAFRFGAWRLVAIDLRNGSTFDVIDAPFLTSGPDPFRLGAAQWLGHSDRLVLGPVYMDPAAPAPEIVEVDLTNRSLTRIEKIEAEAFSNTQFNLSGDTSLSISDNISPRKRHYQLLDGRWRQAIADYASKPPQHEATPAVSIREELNTPPDIFVTNAKGKSSRLTDLNPQWRSAATGRARLFEWADNLGRRHTGGLLVPETFRSGVRHPLVIIPEYFDPTRFMNDGVASRFSKRALAARGFLVLELPRSTYDQNFKAREGEWSREGEMPRFLAMLEGAIAEIVKEGLADPERLGLFGFSRNGMLIEYATTFSKYNIRAAVIADSFMASPSEYGFMFPYMSGFEKDWFMGAPFWDDDRKLWYERSPYFNMDKIKAAIRTEVYGPLYTPRFEAFGIMRRMGRPVEMIHIPYASHQLTSPWARLTSHEGSIDWFDFWINGSEDPNPEKREQYKRWEALRDTWQKVQRVEAGQ